MTRFVPQSLRFLAIVASMGWLWCLSQWGTPTPVMAQPSSMPADDFADPFLADPSTTTLQDGSDPNGNHLLSQAIGPLEQHPSVQAKLRQRIRLFGHTLIGSGSYRQLRQGSDLLVRLDIKIQLGDRSATLQQISDGRFLWKFQDSPDLEKLGVFRQQISRVDLDVVRQAVPADGSPPPPLAITYGGLPRLLSQIEKHFEFESPQSGTLYQVPVWMVTGTWCESPRSEILLPQEDGDSGPDSSEPEPHARAVQIPDRVTLLLGKDDLFPYRIEFRRESAEVARKEIAVTAKSQALVIMELFEVQIGMPIQPSEFVRRAGDLPVDNVTQEFLDQNGLIQPPGPAR